jgi:hypothetical protein
MSLAAAQTASLKQRRRRRIERELSALYAMQGHLRAWDIVCAVLAIPALTLLCLGLAFKLHWVSASVPLALIGAIAAGALIWWIGRHYLVLAVLIVFGLILVIFESGPDWFDVPGTDNKKARRRAKLEQAISKREALLRTLDGAKT